MMRIYLVRHSMTEGNRQKRYIGKTDEELCPEGIALLRGRNYPEVQRIYASPRKRCLQTAAFIYPGQEVTVAEELAECDFGRFENKNYQELAGDPEYQQWVDSGGRLPFPGGESREEFERRSIRGFERILEECRKDRTWTIALVVHGGTVMSIMEQYAVPAGEYYDYQVGNGDGYELIITDAIAYGISGGGRLPAGSLAGRSPVAVSSGPGDRSSDHLSGKNYSKLFAKE